MDSALEPVTAEPVDYIAETRRTYDALGYPPYRWVASEEPPGWAELARPLSEAKIGLIGSGGVYESGQIAFHYADDTSFRVIDTRVDTSRLRATHFAYNLTDAREDINVVFPLDPLRSLVEDGTIGSLARESYAFMGGIYSARKVRDDLAPALVARMVEQEVDAVLLVPV